jgi:hypothetical protein
MNGMPSAAHSRPTDDRMSIIPDSVSPPSAVKSTTASAPSTSASSTSAICTISGRSPPGSAEADRSSASDVVGENAGSAIRIMPLLIMITFAPPATVSRVRASMSARGSRNVGEVMPWSSAQITDTPAGSTTRLSRMDFPVVVIVPPRSCGVWQTWVDGGEPGRGSLGPPLD